MKKKSEIKLPVYEDKNVIDLGTGKQVHDGMKEYGLYSIWDRAIPDFRDGCKPIQRRLLYSMYTLHVTSSGNTVKCSRIASDTIGRFHPHGDVSSYLALVSMTHVKYPLVEGQGNFGIYVAGKKFDNAAAPRYTEARFKKLISQEFPCINVAEMTPNYSETEKEPLVINTRIPYLFLNGCSGIAVGVTTNMPSHNIEEVVKSLIYVASTKEPTVEELVTFLQGPDFSGGGSLLSSKEDVMSLYEHGYGKLTWMCDYRIEQENDVTNITVYGFPDGFRIKKLMSSLDAMSEKRVIRYYEHDFEMPVGKSSKNDKIFVIRIGVDNEKSFEEVKKLLVFTDSYFFNVTIRNSADNITLYSHVPMISLMQNWISWRKNEEFKVIHNVINNLMAEKSKEILRYKAIVHLAIIMEALKQSEILPEKYLSDKLNISIEDAKFIGSIPVFQLKKANKNTQESKIEELSSKIKDCENSLLNLTEVVINYLKELSPYFDKRCTSLSFKQKDNFVNTTDPIIIAASSTSGKLYNHIEEKQAISSKIYAVGTYSGGTIVSSSGSAKRLSISEFDGVAGLAYRDIIGLVNHESEYIFSVSEDGMYTLIENNDKKMEYQIMSCVSSKLLYSTGVNLNDKVLIWYKKNLKTLVAIKSVSSLKIFSRLGTNGLKLFNGDIVNIAVYRNNSELIDNCGKVLSIDQIKDNTNIFCVGSRNLIQASNGHLYVADCAKTKKIVESKPCILYDVEL